MQDKKGVDKAAEDHWNELHTLMPVLPDTAPTSEESGSVYNSNIFNVFVLWR